MAGSDGQSRILIGWAAMAPVARSPVAGRVNVPELRMPTETGGVGP